MKEVKLTMIMKVSDEYYEEELKKLKDEILSGEHQRDMMKDAKRFNKGMKAYKATFEVITNH
jgi:ketol-acid reductoisomerase|tara:strand:- start:19057 stop:19242 length:186 start_codon:yes stop_codon:yes gene_type:complete